MQELAAALGKFTQLATTDDVKPNELPAGMPDFSDVATIWSSYCLHNLRGDLLRLGLEIAKALSEFDRGLKYPETLKD